MRPVIYGALLLKPWELRRLTPGEVLDMVHAALDWQEWPGSTAWAVAQWLNASGSQIPWTARTILGRPIDSTHG